MSMCSLGNFVRSVLFHTSSNAHVQTSWPFCSFKKAQHSQELNLWHLRLNPSPHSQCAPSKPGADLAVLGPELDLQTSMCCGVAGCPCACSQHMWRSTGTIDVHSFLPPFKRMCPPDKFRHCQSWHLSQELTGGKLWKARFPVNCLSFSLVLRL